MPEHFDPPNKGATRRKKSMGRPGEPACRGALPSGPRSPDTRFSAGEACAPGVGRRLLFQPEPGAQPIRQRMIVMQSQAELGDQSRQEVSTAHGASSCDKTARCSSAFHSCQSTGKNTRGRHQPIVAGAVSSDVSRSSTVLEGRTTRRVGSRRLRSKSRSPTGTLRACNRF